MQHLHQTKALVCGFKSTIHPILKKGRTHDMFKSLWNHDHVNGGSALHIIQARYDNLLRRAENKSLAKSIELA